MNLKTILILTAVLVASVGVLWFVNKQISYAPTSSPTTTQIQGESLNEDLNTLDNTDLDSGVDNGLNQISSDSSSF